MPKARSDDDQTDPEQSQSLIPNADIIEAEAQQSTTSRPLLHPTRRQSSFSKRGAKGVPWTPRTTNRVRFDIVEETTNRHEMREQGQTQCVQENGTTSEDEDDVEDEDQTMYRRASTGQRAPLLTNIEAPSVTVANELDFHAEDFLENARPKSGMRSAFVNMANSIIGAGIIGQPYAFRQAGLVTGICLLIGLTVTVDWTIRLIIINSKLSGANSFQGTMEHCFGKSGLVAISVAQWAFAFEGARVPSEYKGALKGSIVIRGGVAQAIGVISFDHNSLLIYGSLKTPTLDRFSQVTHYSAFVSLVACLIVALAGFFSFGDKTMGNVLNNFPLDNIMTQAKTGHLKIQIDLGFERTNVFESDFKENKHITSNQRLQAHRLFTQEGTVQSRAIQGRENKISDWNAAWGALRTDGTAEEKDLRDVGTGFGQSHRQRLNCDDSVSKYAGEQLLRKKKQNPQNTISASSNLINAQKSPRSPGFKAASTTEKVSNTSSALIDAQYNLSSKSKSGQNFSKIPSTLPTSARSKTSITRNRVKRSSPPTQLSTPAMDARPSIEPQERGKTQIKNEQLPQVANSFKRQGRHYNESATLSDPPSFMAIARTRLSSSKAASKATPDTVSQSIPNLASPLSNPSRTKADDAEHHPSQITPHSISNFSRPSNSESHFVKPDKLIGHNAAHNGIASVIPGSSLTDAPPGKLSEALKLLKTMFPLEKDFDDVATKIKAKLAEDSVVAPAVRPISNDSNETNTSSVTLTDQAKILDVLNETKAFMTQDGNTSFVDSRKQGTINSDNIAATGAAANTKPSLASNPSRKAQSYTAISEVTPEVVQLDTAPRERRQKAQRVRFEEPEEPTAPPASGTIEATMQRALNAKLQTFVHKERNDKYTCLIDNCYKAFSDEQFWQKHVHRKHQDHFDGLKSKAMEHARANKAADAAAAKVEPAPTVQDQHELEAVNAKNIEISGPLKMPRDIPVVIKRSSLADIISRQQDAWRDHLIGEHIQKTRFIKNPALKADNPVRSGDIDTSSTLEAAATIHTNAGNEASQEPLASKNPFGLPKSSKVITAETISTFADPGRAARMQYGGQLSVPADHSVPPLSERNPPQATSGSQANVKDAPPPPSFRPAQRVTPGRNTGPTLPTFLTAAPASMDPGAAARRQYNS
ncbi:uncharacterized protein KY384_006920 [Bacidia gigantensis]|uniref:uncharacterized protein n=1 Tax=Bacidia gigantensis TaxID=2732470 RepID=UPI001D04ADB5|nr:uncharacterized protein KY384_006920 [Bacidia gigantensis]KAG8528004.1 hypothetical protein KY384_006920 [Bacidia gigantensis]